MSTKKRAPRRPRPTRPAPASGLRLTTPPTGPQAKVLSTPALRFLTELHREFEPRRRDLLERRAAARAAIKGGAMPDFAPDTRTIREGDWTVAAIPRDLQDRRVEITGPVDRKMVINALNSGASVYMADFEDANSPTWANNVDGQINLRDAVRRTITFTNPQGKRYALNPTTAVLFVRPRGWHLLERHCLVDGDPISGSLFDFGLFFFHNAQEQLERGSGPYFYLPKLEHAAEARLWNDVFVFAQDAVGVPRGSIRATVLIENILASFQMHEILWELRDHSAGLNCGRWDYIFSFIKTFADREAFVLPDRDQVTMNRHFLSSYVDLLIQTCHRRRIHAMGGMAAQIPIKGDSTANARAIEKVRQDKLREVRAGHDGTWVAHPGLVPIAKAIFDEHMPQPNQIDRTRAEVRIAPADLLAVPDGTVTAAGLRHNVDVGVRYLEAWLRGSGCVPIYDLMEDAATSEISRTQVWQWMRHRVPLDDGRAVNAALVRATVRDVLGSLKAELGRGYAKTQFPLAATLFEQLMTAPDCPEWLTLVAYDHID
ncbi:MAG: malate synthase A [Gemmatimonadota bacterium]|nr:malate synthase A [Gemmatimonadota bacterium]